MKRTSIALLLVSILGAISGYLRELSMAMTYGAGRYTDAYFVAASIPMVIGDLIIGSVLTAGIVPVFSRLRVDGEQAKSTAPFLNAVLLVVVVFGVLFAIAVSVLMPVLINLLVPGFDDAARALVARYAYWLIWLLPINGTILLVNLVLNSYRVFIQPAITWLAANLFFFLIIIFGHEFLGADTLIWAAMSGPILMLFTNLWRLRKEGLLHLARPVFSSPVFHSAIVLARPVLLTFGIGSGLGLLMVSHVILRIYGSNYGEGAVSALGYAFRIYEVPITLLTSTAGVLVLPVFSTLFHLQDQEKLVRLSRDIMGWGLLLLLPLSLLVFFLAEPLIHVLFYGGAFKAKDVLLTTQALQGFAPAILFETLFMIFFRMFYGLHRSGITVGIGFVTLVTLYVILEYVGQPHSLEGLAMSLSVSFSVAAVLSVSGMVYLLGWSALPSKKELLVSVCLTALGAVMFGFWRHWTAIGMVAWTIIGTLVFTVVYTGMLWILLPDRASSIVAILKGRGHTPH